MQSFLLKKSTVRSLRGMWVGPDVIQLLLAQLSSLYLSGSVSTKRYLLIKHLVNLDDED